MATGWEYRGTTVCSERKIFCIKRAIEAVPSSLSIAKFGATPNQILVFKLPRLRCSRMTLSNGTCCIVAVRSIWILFRFIFSAIHWESWRNGFGSLLFQFPGGMSLYGSRSFSVRAIFRFYMSALPSEWCRIPAEELRAAHLVRLRIRGVFSYLKPLPRCSQRTIIRMKASWLALKFVSLAGLSWYVVQRAGPFLPVAHLLDELFYGYSSRDHPTIVFLDMRRSRGLPNLRHAEALFWRRRASTSTISKTVTSQLVRAICALLFSSAWQYLHILRTNFR